MKILLYNLYFNTFYSVFDVLRINQLDKYTQNIFLTTDKNLINDMDVVLFNVPHLAFHLKETITKKSGQIWVGWNLECEKNYPWILSKEIDSLFDIWMTYHPDCDVPIPYLNDTFIERLKLAAPLFPEKDICMFISSPVNSSHRVEYLKELMKHIPIDSFGRLFHNKDVANDTGYLTKQKILSGYKFVISFENAIYDDYVTEKFYDPLLAGSIPVYLGAPNIDVFSPGENAFVDVRKYSDPAELAMVLREYCQKKDSLDYFYEWKQNNLNPDFLEIANYQTVHPFERLIKRIENFKTKKMVEEQIAIKIGNGVLKYF
ncbi:alpha-1,3-fucosyltransferase [Bacteroidia bacterium]|nr:alpha-1,3-fucosyltransferase [Bacteroidia bacterium]